MNQKQVFKILKFFKNSLKKLENLPKPLESCWTRGLVGGW